MKNNKRLNVGIFISSLLDSYQKRIWDGIINKAKEYNINLITYIGGDLKSTYHFYSGRTKVYDLFNKKQINGLIILSNVIGSYLSNTELEKFLNKYSHIPMISIGYASKEINSLVVNNESSMRQLVEHFIIDHRYKKIAFICGRKNNNEAKLRLEVYKKVLIENDIKVEEKLILPGDFLPISGKNAVKELLDNRKVSFDAILAANDYMAIGAIEELHERGYKIPEDAAVGGFDNVAESIYSSPPLTTVHQSPYNMGIIALENLISLLKGEKIKKNTKLPGMIIKRYSCGCLEYNKNINDDLKIISNYNFNNKNKIDLIKVYKPLIVKIINEYFLIVIDKSIVLEWSEKILKSFLKSIELMNNEIFIKSFNEILNTSEKFNSEITNWNDILFQIFSIFKFQKNHDELIFIDNLLYKSIEAVKNKILKIEKEEKLRSIRLDWELIGISFQAINKIENLCNTFASEFIKINVPAAYLSLYKDDTKNTELKIVYEDYKIKKTDIEVYPITELLPSKYFNKKLKKNYIVMSLFYEDDQFGYIVYEMGPKSGKVYELLTLQLSGIIKQIKMFEKINEYTKSLEIKVKERTVKLEEAYNNIEDKNKELQKLDTLKNEFIANITHDFRSPLTAILNLSDLILKSKTDNKEFNEFIELIYNASIKLKSTIDRLLNLAKMDSSGIRIKINKINIISFLEMILNFFTSSVIGTGIKVKRKFFHSDIYIYTDYEKLEQIINNIVSNAIKFTNHDSGEILIDLIDKEKSIIISIADNGIGIPKDKINNIFNRFEQAHSGIQNKYGGTGIGLAFSKQLTALIKGEIWAESEGLNKGSVFYIKLPKNKNVFNDVRQDLIKFSDVSIINDFVKSNQKEIKTILYDEINKYQGSEKAVLKFTNLNNDFEYDVLKSKILIIDDNKDIVNIVEKYLSNHGYHNFILAFDGKQGLDAVYKYHPDIIISDFNMPNMGGDQLHDEILSNPNFNNIPFIFLSAVADANVIFNRRKKGANAYLKKPIDEHELLLAVENHLTAYFKYLKLKRLAAVDELVGLYNRHTIMNNLLHELSIRKYRDLSIILFDVDNFREINEAFGHSFGDKVLIRISEILIKNKRSYDLIGRYGDDEFLIILPETNIKQANIFAKNFKKRIEGLYLNYEDKKVNLTISVGISSLLDNSETLCNMLYISDLKSIYEIKEPDKVDWKKIDDMKKKISGSLLELTESALTMAKKSVCENCDFISEKRYIFKDNKCPRCGSKKIILGKNKIITSQ